MLEAKALSLHPVRNPRFVSFRTQPLENLSAAVKLPINRRFLGNPTLGTNLGSRILAMRTGCTCSVPPVVAAGAQSLRLTRDRKTALNWGAHRPRRCSLFKLICSGQTLFVVRCPVRRCSLPAMLRFYPEAQMRSRTLRAIFRPLMTSNTMNDLTKLKEQQYSEQ